MLKTADEKKSITKEAYAELKPQLQNELLLLQQRIRTAEIPVMIIFEGWGAAGKGSRIADLVSVWDPRGYKVHSLVEPDESELRYPPLRRYWQKIPPKGEIAIFDRSWYRDIMSRKLSKKERQEKIEDILVFERQLADNGYVIIKFFLHITRAEQSRRFKKLLDDKNTEWRISKDDLKQHKDYKAFYELYNTILDLTSPDFAPWHVISSDEKRYCRAEIDKTAAAVLETALHRKENGSAVPPLFQVHSFEPEPVPAFEDIDLKTALSADEYGKQLEAGQKRLAELHNILYRKKISAVIAFEGWDGAGKGGAIKRLSRGLDARGYEVIPIAAPLPCEKNRQHLWRFWNVLPKTGHITIFDRTWYGRCMVERIEGFCSETDWKRSYNEINEFEEYLTRAGIAIIKFWLHIDKNEQLRRFNERENTPEKNWKITEEDWRNRKKWAPYQNAAQEMFAKTSTIFAPWTIIAGNDKNYARIQVIQTVIAALEKRIGGK